MFELNSKVYIVAILPTEGNSSNVVTMFVPTAVEFQISDMMSVSNTQRQYNSTTP